MTGERILIIDDSRDIREIIINYILKPYAFDYDEAVDGQEGLDKIKSWEPELILLDFYLPKLNGLEVLQRLHEEKINIPVILMTSEGSEKIAVDVFRLGVRNYVIKPFDPEEFLLAIEDALTETRLRTERDKLNTDMSSLNEGLKKQIEEVETLYQIGRELTTISNPELLAIRLIESAAGYPSVSHAELLFLEENTTLIQRAKTSSEGVELRNHVIENDLARQAVEANETRIGEPEIDSTGEDFNVQVCIPLNVGETQGILAFTIPAESLSDHQIKLLNALAVYAAISLERARLLRHLEV